MIKYRFNPDEDVQLLDYLYKHVPEAKNKVKGYLSREQILVQDDVVTQFNHLVNKGETIKVLTKKQDTKAVRHMEILYEDDAIIVINKQAGLLTIATQKNEVKPTAHRLLSEYLQKQQPHTRIYIVHRLDRDTSGVLVFAKTEQVKKILQEEWKTRVLERTYQALVEGRVKKDNDTIESYLKETKTHQMYVTQSSKEATYAKLTYRVTKRFKQETLLDVSLDTGRKNQIRVQLASIGHPIVGDKKYRAHTNTIKRLGLHAKTLVFNHPLTNETLTFTSALPTSFLKRP